MRYLQNYDLTLWYDIWNGVVFFWLHCTSLPYAITYRTRTMNWWCILFEKIFAKVFELKDVYCYFYFLWQIYQNAISLLTLPAPVPDKDKSLFSHFLVVSQKVLWRPLRMWTLFTQGLPSNMRLPPISVVPQNAALFYRFNHNPM